MIYFPMTADILTPGHIKCIKWLEERDKVIIGLLTDDALKGYKKNSVPFKDRLFVLEAVTDSQIVPQETLDPKKNLLKYGCKSIASGDGWETEEFDTIKELGLKPVNIEFAGDRYSTSAIKRRVIANN